MKTTIKELLTLSAGICLSGSVAAADLAFSGNIANHNDIVSVWFSLSAERPLVQVWTDSFKSGTNFDPIIAGWSQSGVNWNLIRENDDNSGIGPGQTSSDSGLSFYNLQAGNYLVTITTYNNFVKGSTLADGFRHDGETPVSLATWCQPANHCGMGTFWRVNLTNVDQANAVPEPGAYAMMLAGVGFLGIAARRRNVPRTV